jgi:hypothetical protein
MTKPKPKYQNTKLLISKYNVKRTSVTPNTINPIKPKLKNKYQTPKYKNQQPNPKQKMSKIQRPYTDNQNQNRK